MRISKLKRNVFEVYSLLKKTKKQRTITCLVFYVQVCISTFGFVSAYEFFNRNNKLCQMHFEN